MVWILGSHVKKWGKCASEGSSNLPKPDSYEMVELRFEHKRLRQVNFNGTILGAMVCG